MSRQIGRFCCYVLLAIALVQTFSWSASAGEREERIQLLQEKMDKLQELLVKMEEAKLREQPPTEIPWQPILQPGDERPAYDQYVYLLAPQMRKEDLDSVLQQMHYLASQDELKERKTLLVVPALPLESGEQMSVTSYDRELAGTFLMQAGIPTALEGGLVVVRDSLEEPGITDEPFLFIDLKGCDRVLRSRILGLLMEQRLFTEDGSIHGYLWALLQNAAPQAFKVYLRGRMLWVSLDEGLE